MIYGCTQVRIFWEVPDQFQSHRGPYSWAGWLITEAAFISLSHTQRAFCFKERIDDACDYVIVCTFDILVFFVYGGETAVAGIMDIWANVGRPIIAKPTLWGTSEACNRDTCWNDDELNASVPWFSVARKTSFRIPIWFIFAKTYEPFRLYIGWPHLWCQWQGERMLILVPIERQAFIFDIISKQAL